MPLNKIQKEVDDWVSQYPESYWPIFEQLARLTEEVGELSRELNHVHGSKKKKATEEANQIGSEMADIMFTLCCLANNQKINLQEEWDKMVSEKLYKRDFNRFERKEN